MCHFTFATRFDLSVAHSEINLFFIYHFPDFIFSWSVCVCVCVSRGEILPCSKTVRTVLEKLDRICGKGIKQVRGTKEYRKDKF